jgi:hypothetical protein
MSCTGCGAETNEGQRFCGQCGTQLQPTMRKPSRKRDADVPREKRLYRYWIEITQLSDGARRRLELKQMVHVPLVDPRERSDLKTNRTLLLEDGTQPIETDTFEEFRAQLRRKYPDEAYERRLWTERNLEAEEAARELTRWSRCERASG